MTDFQNIEYAQTGIVGQITLNRPDRLNPLNSDTIDELNVCLSELAEEVEIIVLKGKGRAFSAGGDLAKYVSLHKDAAALKDLQARVSILTRWIDQSDRIVIAVIDGLCAGGAFEFLLCFDFVLASEEATFLDGHLNVGMLGGAGGATRMTRSLGILRTKDLILTGRPIKGREAAEIGLVTYCVPSKDLDARLDELVAQLSQKSFTGRSQVKRQINAVADRTQEESLKIEMKLSLDYITTSPDVAEGLQSFSAKTKPNFLSRKTLRGGG
jgi:enoyl-CoA hydratase